MSLCVRECHRVCQSVIETCDIESPSVTECQRVSCHRVSLSVGVSGRCVAMM